MRIMLFSYLLVQYPLVLEIESTPVENAMKSVEITSDLEYCINLIGKTVAEFKKINSNVE